MRAAVSTTVRTGRPAVCAGVELCARSQEEWHRIESFDISSSNMCCPSSPATPVFIIIYLFIYLFILPSDNVQGVLFIQNENIMQICTSVKIRGAILNTWTYGTDKNLPVCILIFLPTIFGPIYYEYGAL